MKYPPYHISHINLHQQLGMPSLDTSQAGHYLVFWWKEIPLGHLFIKPQEKLDEREYYQKLNIAIRPALQQYTKDMAAATPGEQWLLNKQNWEWTSWMESVFSPLIPQALPARVSVSIIICTRNRATYLKRCLELLKSLQCLPQEVIVVDNAPSDNSTELLVQQFPEVKYCREPTAGLDIARNTGIHNATAPIVAFLDDDVVAHPMWVYRVWEAFQHPDTAAITGLVIAAELQTEAQQIFEQHWSFNRGYIHKMYDEAYFKSTLAQGPPVWEIGAGANMAFQKDVFEKVGYFDELLDVGAAGCNGDSEMWFRILAGGYNIRYTPLAVVHHEHRKEIKGLQKQIFYYMRGFAAAALLQQQMQQKAGYKKHLISVLPGYYVKLIRQGFPRFPFRHRTIGSEIKGLVSGVLFYLRNKYQSSKK